MPSGNFHEDEGAAAAGVGGLLSVVSLIIGNDVSKPTNGNGLVSVFGTTVVLRICFWEKRSRHGRTSVRIHSRHAGA